MSHHRENESERRCSAIVSGYVIIYISCRHDATCPAGVGVGVGVGVGTVVDVGIYQLMPVYRPQYAV